MNKLSTSYKSQAFLIFALWQIGMTFSMEFLLSICMIAMIMLSFFQRDEQSTGFRLKVRSTLRDNFEKFLKDKSFLLITIPFFLVLFTSVYSADWQYTLERLRVKIPFLLLPFAFFSLPNIEKKDLQKILFFQLFLACVAAIGVGGNYLIDFDAITNKLSSGGAIPTPGNHIRFSLILAFSVIAGASLFWTNLSDRQDEVQLKYSFERTLVLLMTLFLFMFMHVLSVRSGLLVLYISIGLLLLRYIFFSRRYLIGLVGMIILLSLPVIAYKTVPSFKNKLSYMEYDLRMYLSGNGANYSDAERLTSLQAGLEVGNEHMWLGVGAGDLRQAIKDKYKKDFPEVNRRMPHNQFITIYAGTGLIGLLFFTFSFFYPIIKGRRFTDALFLTINAIIFFSFMMESTIENAVGIAFYLFYLLIILRYLSYRGIQKI